MLYNRLLIRRITTVKSVVNSQKQIVGWKAECNHNSPPEMHMYPLSQWGDIAQELAEEWALLHKCHGDYIATHTPNKSER